jgi:hypothetical protein
MTNYWIPPLENSKDGGDFAMLVAPGFFNLGVKPNSSSEIQGFSPNNLSCSRRNSHKYEIIC